MGGGPLPFQQFDRRFVEGHERLPAVESAVESDHPVRKVAARIEDSQARFHRRAIDDDVLRVDHASDRGGNFGPGFLVESFQNPGEFAQ